MKLGLDFYLREDVTLIARELLGKVIFTRFDRVLTSGIISETEAYAGITDKASHAYNNRRTNRTDVMFQQGGKAYVYLCYGIHHLFNFVTNQEGVPHAILLRGIIPFSGVEIMEERRGIINKTIGFTDGPGKVSKAMGINVKHSGLDLTGNKIWVEDRNFQVSKDDIKIGPRIGVDYAGEDAQRPYRYLLTKSFT
jgi:DNA-3-methyladenine glycosylase